jgi:hypothetical protein
MLWRDGSVTGDGKPGARSIEIEIEIDERIVQFRKERRYELVIMARARTSTHPTMRTELCGGGGAMVPPGVALSLAGTSSQFVLMIRFSRSWSAARTRMKVVLRVCECMGALLGIIGPHSAGKRDVSNWLTWHYLLVDAVESHVHLY